MSQKRLIYMCGLSLFALPLLVAWVGGQADSGPLRSEAKGRRRRPVALVLAGDGRWLFVANRRSGSVSAIDTRGPKVVGEVDVGRRLADLAATPDGRHLLAVDEDANELIVLARRGSVLTVAHRLAVAPYPVGIQVAGDGARCFIASLWSRRLTVVDLPPGAAPKVARTVALPFAPRKLLVVSGGKLVVADSFGGRLAVLDVQRGAVDSVRKLPAHNVRGLALSAGGKQLLLAHQVLNPTTETTRDNVHWGNVLTNDLRALPLAAVLKPGSDVLRNSQLYQIDEVTRGGADPSGLAVAGNNVVVTLGGTGEIALNPQHPDGAIRLKVGRRPTAVLVAPDGRHAYVANTLSDSVSVVDLRSRKVTATVSLGAAADLTAADEGEVLFHDGRLAHDGWLSCHSCHTDGHTNGRRNDNLGDGSYGAPKRVLSLLGVKDTGPWAWNGSQPDLESQIRKSILTTMHGRKPTETQVRALAAYLRTLAPAPPRGRFIRSDEGAVRRGRDVFTSNGCANCHAPPAYTARRTYDVGLVDEVGNKQFNPPSLRGVSQGGPFFHDGRAATLEEVFTRHRHQLKNKLSEQELGDLLAFLASL